MHFLLVPIICLHQILFDLGKKTQVQVLFLRSIRR
jgi:hypothetical protein